MNAGLNTSWTSTGGNTFIVPPTITANSPAGLATITKVDGTGGAFTLNETLNVDNLPSGFITLQFVTSNVTVEHESLGSVYFHMLGNTNKTPSTGDVIVFKNLGHDGLGHIILKQIF